MTLRLTVGESDAVLDQRLSDELDGFNATAAAGPAAKELTVRFTDNAGELVAGLSGWTWQEAAGIAMTWVRHDMRGRSLGTRLLEAFEAEAHARGVRRIFVTSFTFQAPGFYQRHGYQEIFRWDGVPSTGNADIHFRKAL